ncbi:GHMP kinase [Candidatus Fermentibacteria bacterium]|nr:GHMP kinase [Candidatus Fermentibacteria bacterium]
MSAAVELFAPGRLCLFGEHSDWAGGHRRSDPSLTPGECLVVGTDQGLYARASDAHGIFALSQIGPDGRRRPPVEYPADPGALRRIARSAGFDSYAAGVAALVLERFPGLGLGLEIHRRTLPLAKGLSSSAAVCVLTARAFDRMHSLGLSIREEMELAYLGELLTGSSCGRMDQACAYGSVPVILNFDGDSMSIREIRPSGRIHLLIVDLHAGKDTRRILADLNAAFLAGREGIRRALGPLNLSMLHRAESALEQGDAEGLGALMTEAQSVFDSLVAPECPSELAAPKLHAVLSHRASRTLAFGGKGVGSQGDGSAQLVCRSAEARLELAAVLEREMGVSCLELTVDP